MTLNPTTFGAQSRVVRALIGSVIVAVSVLWYTAACGPAGDTSSPVAGPRVRDSAGIEIIKSTAPLWREGEEWQVSEEPSVVFGGLDSPVSDLVWQVRGGARLSDGRVVLLVGGSESPRIVLFDRDGSVVRTIGRLGRGPGEFRQPNHLQRLPGDTLVVWERFFGRITAFDTVGTVAWDRHLDLQRVLDIVGTGGEPDVEVPLTDGSFIARAPLPSTVRGRTDGEVYWAGRRFTWVRPDYSADTLGVYPGRQYLARRSPTGTITPGVILNRSNTYLTAGGNPPHVFVIGVAPDTETGLLRGIHVFDASARLIRILRRDVLPVPFTEKDRRELIESNAEINGIPHDQRRAWEERQDYMVLPYRSEMYQGVVDSRSMLWVTRWTEGGKREMLVFGPERGWLGSVMIPAPMLGAILEIGENHLLIVQRDTLGVESVHEYRIDRGSRIPRGLD